MLLPMPGLRPAGAAAAAEAAAAEAEAAAGGAGLGVALDELGRDANMERRREAAERSARRRGRLQRDLERLQRQGQARRRPALTLTLTHPNPFPAVLRGRLQRDLERLQRQDQARWGRPPARPCLRRRRGRPQARPQRRRWSRTWHGAVPPLLWLVRQGRAQPPGEPGAARCVCLALVASAARSAHPHSTLLRVKAPWNGRFVGAQQAQGL